MKNHLEHDLSPFTHLLEELLLCLYSDAVKELDAISELAELLRLDVKDIDQKEPSLDVSELKEHCNELVTHSQFADRITQRIDNVGKVVVLLRNFLEGSSEDEDFDWYDAIEKIRASFTMEQEHNVMSKVFDFSSLIDSVRKDLDCGDMQTF